jgi:hypothetical protein
MTTERVAGSGAWRVSEYVTDGTMTWLRSELSFGYSKREAQRAFRRTVREQGLKIVYP